MKRKIISTKMDNKKEQHLGFTGWLAKNIKSNNVLLNNLTKPLIIHLNKKEFLTVVSYLDSKNPKNLHAMKIKWAMHDLLKVMRERETIEDGSDIMSCCYTVVIREAHTEKQKAPWEKEQIQRGVIELSEISKALKLSMNDILSSNELDNYTMDSLQLALQNNCPSS
jgi:hypothetical protein